MERMERMETTWEGLEARLRRLPPLAASNPDPSMASTSSW